MRLDKPDHLSLCYYLHTTLTSLLLSKDISDAGVQRDLHHHRILPRWVVDKLRLYYCHDLSSHTGILGPSFRQQMSRRTDNLMGFDRDRAVLERSCHGPSTSVVVGAESTETTEVGNKRHLRTWKLCMHCVRRALPIPVGTEGNGYVLDNCWRRSLAYRGNKRRCCVRLPSSNTAYDDSSSYSTYSPLFLVYEKQRLYI